MLLLILFCTSVFLFWAYSKRNINKNEPPTYVRKVTIRNMLRVAKDSDRIWAYWQKLSKEALKQGGTLKTSFGPRTAYVVSDPEDFLTVSNACFQKDALYSFAKGWLGDGLITAPISKWKVHRKILEPSFSHHVLDDFIDVFNDQSRHLVKNLEVEVGRGPFDHYIYTRHYALETICLTALGANFMDNNEIKNSYTETVQKLFQIYVRRLQFFWLHNDFLYSLSSLKKEEDKCVATLCNISNTILKKIKSESKINVTNKEENKSKGSKFKPYMNLLLEYSQNQKVFTDREIREHVETIIAAGEDTSAGVAMYCLLLVGAHPRVQQKIYEELKQVFGDEDKDVVKEDLTKLVYLEAVIKESMRIYPVISVIGRYIDKDVKLRNCTLSKGRTAFLSIYGVHRHQMWGPDVEEFKPERWLHPSTLPSHSNAFAGFSMGRRTCIGKTYALMSLKISMTHIFKNYIIYSDLSQLKLSLEISLKAISGHHITIEKRKK